MSAISDREINLVLGGARSGKSRRAESLITVCSAPWYYVAIAERLDDEMRARIVEHRARGGADWRVIDAPSDLAGVLAAASGGNAILLDCLTLWLSNLMLAEGDIPGRDRSPGDRAIVDRRIVGAASSPRQHCDLIANP